MKTKLLTILTILTIFLAMGVPVTSASAPVSSPEQTSTLADSWSSLWAAFNAIVAAYNSIVSSFNAMTGSSIPTYAPSGGGGTTYTPPPPPPPPPPSPTMNIWASPTSVAAGQPVTISWSSSNANNCTGGLYGGSIGTSGSFTAYPSETLSYAITCSGSGGSITKSVIVNVIHPTINISADSYSITAGKSAKISWSTTNATSCTASGGWSGSKGINGSESVSPIETTEYTLSCSGPGGSVSKSVKITVTMPPTMGLYIPSYVSYDRPVYSVVWDSSNTTNCSYSGVRPGFDVRSPDYLSNSNAGTSGSIDFLKQGSSITVTCTGPGGSVTESNPGLVNDLYYMKPSKPTISLSATPSSTNFGGEPVLISWSTTNALYCMAGWDGWRDRKNNGSEIVYPNSTTDYSLRCSGPGGDTVQSTGVTVTGAPMVPINVPGSRGLITKHVNEGYTIYWGIANVINGIVNGPGLPSRSISAGASPVYDSIKLSQSARGDYTYTVSGTGPNGQMRTASVTVRVINNPPKCDFKGDPGTIVPPQSSTLLWTCSEADACSIDQGIGNVTAPSGSKAVSPTKTTTYTLSCSNPDAKDTFSTTVNIAQPFIKEVRP
jgi:hypothetical protein